MDHLRHRRGRVTQALGETGLDHVDALRHELVADYKAGRVAAPDILRQQMGLVRQVVETLQIPIVEIAGFEADDVIATLATEAEAAGDEVIVVTGDRDAYQLVHDPLVKV